MIGYHRSRPVSAHPQLNTPNISFLVDYKDFRFNGLKATQSPQFLNQAPPFDLQDAIRFPVTIKSESNS
jgi:hypothetical protein